MGKLQQRIARQMDRDLMKAITGNVEQAGAVPKEPFSLKMLEDLMDKLPNRLVILSSEIFDKSNTVKVSDSRFDMLAMHPDTVLQLRCALVGTPDENHMPRVVLDADDSWPEWSKRYGNAVMAAMR